MAIQIDTLELPISAAEARDFLQMQTDSFGIFFDVERCWEIVGYLQLEMLRMRNEARHIAGNPAFDLVNKNRVVSQFISMGVSKSFFKTNRSGDYSLTAQVLQDIIDNPYHSDEVKEIAKLRSEITSHKRNMGNIRNFARLPKSVALSKLNRAMSVGHPLWSVLNTSRIAAKDPGIQGIPRSMGDIICEPKGYTLVRCDSGQIEPRINFSTFLRDELIMHLIMLYNDAYYGLLHYCLIPDDQLDWARNHISEVNKIEITDDIKDNRQNIKRLTNAGSYGSKNLGNINPKLAKVYEQRIVKHPARIALEAKVRKDVAHGVNTFYGMFGTPVTPDETERYTKDADGWTDHVIRCGINNPVQTTASELMMFSVNEARRILKEAEDTHVCYYKHDEACFYVSDKDMANGIGKALEDITAYNVKGWIPIDSEAVYGVKKPQLPTVIPA